MKQYLNNMAVRVMMTYEKSRIDKILDSDGPEDAHYFVYYNIKYFVLTNIILHINLLF